MADKFWENDETVSSGPASSETNFWEGDADAAKQDLPKGVKPSTEGGGRGSVNPPRIAAMMSDEELAKPAGAMGKTIERKDPPKRTLLERSVEGAPIEMADAARRKVLERQERRANWNEDQIAGGPTARTSDPKVVDQAEQRGGNFAAGPVGSTAVGRVGAKVVTGLAQGLGGLTQAVGDVTGIDTIARVGKATAEGAQAFDKGMGTRGDIEGFGPRSPVPYLAEQAEGAASSLGQSAVIAAGVGARSVIGVQAALQGGQSYSEARKAGLDPAAALARAVPQGAFEAIGEKFTGLDRVAGAMGTLLQKGAGEAAKRTAADVLVRAGIKEIPGEVLTYLGQTGTDLLPGIGLNPNLTMEQFLDGLRDTVIQSGLMGGAVGLGGAAAGGRARAPSPTVAAQALGGLDATTPATPPVEAAGGPIAAAAAPVQPAPAAAPVPTAEPPSDTAAQIAAIRRPDSGKTAALITPNTSTNGIDLAGLQVVPTKMGTFVTSDPDAARAVEALGDDITDDQMGLALGYTTPKDQTDGTVVQALDGEGNVVHEEATNAANLENAATRALGMATEDGSVVQTDAIAAQQSRQERMPGALTRAAQAAGSVTPEGRPTAMNDPKARPKTFAEQQQSMSAVAALEAEQDAQSEFEAAMLADETLPDLPDNESSTTKGAQDAAPRSKAVVNEVAAPAATPKPSPAPKPAADAAVTPAQPAPARNNRKDDRGARAPDAPAAAELGAVDATATPRAVDRTEPAADAPSGAYESLAAATAYIRAQRARGSNITAAPFVNDDGEIVIATKGTPEYERALDQRQERLTKDKTDDGNSRKSRPVAGARKGSGRTDDAGGMDAARGRTPAAGAPVPARAGADGVEAGAARLADGRPDAALKKQKVAADEPALADGMVRLYHGSAQAGRYDGPAWFSTDRKYAENYRPGAELQYVDMPADKVNAIADPDGYGQTVEAGFTVNKEFDAAETGERKPLLKAVEPARTAPEHAGVDGTGPKSKQFTSEALTTARAQVEAAAAEWTAFSAEHADQLEGKNKKRKPKATAPEAVRERFEAYVRMRDAASDAYNAALKTEKLGVAAGQPKTTTADIVDGRVPMTINTEAFKVVTDEFATLFADPEPGEVVRMGDKAKAEPTLTIEQAKARIDEWKAHAKAQFDDPKSRRANASKTVLSLFDLTGEWSKPWEEAGYNVQRFDIQSGQDVFDFSVEYFTENYDLTDVYAILAATPCTDFASSGAKHFLKKDAAGQTEQSVKLVTQTAATIEYFRPPVWSLENPVGRIQNLTGLPDPRLSFDPNHFGDPYTKKTMIWGNFNADLPAAPVEATEGSKMHSQFGGKSIETKNARSETPEGFAYAFFMANNYIDRPADQKLAAEYPEASGAVQEALKAGVSEERIHELMENTYGNYEYDEARTVLAEEVADMRAQATATPLDAAANAAATSAHSDAPAPTTAQKLAGNYQMGHLSGDMTQGVDITIENPKDSVRSGTAPDGTAWSNTMGGHYGYAKRSLAADGDHVDVFVGPAAERAPTVYVIDQVNADGTYDEAKAMFGYMNKAAALKAYRSSYSKGWKVGPVTAMPVAEFKEGLESGRFKKPIDPSLAAPAKPEIAKLRNSAISAESSAPAAPKPKRELKADRIAREAEEARATYFAPGNVVRSYGGQFDKVIAYQPAKDGRWSVTVQHVKKTGPATFEDIPGEPTRTHSTQPDERALRTGPAARMAAPAAQDGEQAAMFSVADQTDTPAFKKWFGDSKVVDSSGKPRVIYHGTNQDFTRFDASRNGQNTKARSSIAFFATENPAEANEYAEMAGRTQIADATTVEKRVADLQRQVEQAEKRGDWDKAERLYLEMEEADLGAINADPSGQNVMPLYASIQNPMVIDMGNNFDADKVVDAIKAAQDGGFDGLKLENVYDPVGDRREGFSTTQWVGFKPSQLKSAIGNRGTFSSKNADLRMRTAEGAATPVKTKPASTEHEAKARRVLSSLQAGMDAHVSFNAVEPDDSTDAGKMLAAVRLTAKRLFGHDVVFVRFNGPAIFNGAMSSLTPNTVFVRVDSSKPHMAILGHELLHSLRQSSPGLYNALEARLNQLTNDNTTGFYDALVGKYQALGMRVPQGTKLREELYADIVGDHFLDPKFWDGMAADQRGLFRRVADAVVKFLDRIIAMLDNSNALGTKELLKDAEEARRVVVSAMRAFSDEARSRTGLAPLPTAASLSATSRKPAAATEFTRRSKVKHVVYHATNADFDTFDTTKSDLGAHFGNIEQANKVAATRLFGRDPGSAPSVMPVYLDLRSPLRLKDVGTFHADGIAPQFAAKGWMTKAEAKAMVDAIDRDWHLRPKFDKQMRELIESKGYDSVVYKNGHEGEGDSYIAFRANQIKSATGNRGTFDRESDDIRMSTGESQTETPAFKKWFGDSTIVKADGTPEVVYHGTDRAFNKFNLKKATQGIVWFTNDRSAIEAGEVGAQGAGIVMPLYAQVKNPAGWKEYDKYGLDELEQRGYDGVVLPENDGTYVGFVFKANQLKSATKNKGTFDEASDDIRLSITGTTPVFADVYGTSAKPSNIAAVDMARVGEIQKNTSGDNTILGMGVHARVLLKDGTESVANQSAGTIFDGAGNTIDANIVTAFKNDQTGAKWIAVKSDPKAASSTFNRTPATAPAAPAPSAAPAVPDAIKKKANPALTRAIFGGSMEYMRDQNGKPVKAKEQIEKYKAIDADERGQMLLRLGHVTADQLKRWKASPLDVFNGAVNNRFRKHFETPGIVWRDDELRSIFKLDDDGIAAYRALRAQADESLARHAVADMLRMAGPDGLAVRDQVLSEPMDVAAITLRDHLLALAAADPARNKLLIDRANMVIDILDRGNDDMGNGRIPDDMKAEARPNPWESTEPTFADRVIYEMQDGRIDLKRTQEAIEKSGAKIREEFDARLAETLYSGRVAKRTQTFLEDDAKPLLQSMALQGIGQVELGDYLHARAAPERNAQIAKVNPDMPDGGAGANSTGLLLTDAAAKQYIADIPQERRDKLEALAKRVDAITKGTRSLLVSEGLEKADVIAAWEAVYTTYVPMFREDVEFSRITTSKRATGSEKKAVNILANVLLQREAAITRAEKNRVKVALYGLALSNPNPKFWVTIRPESDRAQMLEDVKSMGIDPVEAEAGMASPPTITTVDPATNLVTEQINPFFRNLPTAITLKINGENRVLVLNEEDPRALRMAAALKGTDDLTQFDLAGSLIGKTTRWLAAVNTQYNPVFGIVNFMRDTMGGVIHLGNTELRGSSAQVIGGLPGALRGIGAHLAGREDSGKWSKLFEQFQMDGGQTGFREMFADGTRRAEAVEKDLKRMAQGPVNGFRLGRNIMSLLSGFNEVTENAVRLSAYAAALDKGLSRQEAARLARELTVDFNRKGRATREIGPLYAFFNAAIQGNERTLRALRGPTGKYIIAGGLALGVAQALMLAAAGYDEDEVPEYAKARALIIPLFNKDKSYILIPLPLGLHVIPNTGRALTEMVIGTQKNLGEKAFKSLGEILGAFNPLGGGDVTTMDGALRTIAPTVVDPLIELGFNKNFAGTPIEREARGETDIRPGHQRARERTQRTTSGQAYLGISKAINSMTGGSEYEAGKVSPTPERLRYLSQVALGGVLRETEKIIDSSTAAARGEKVSPAGVPVAGRFFGKVDGDRVQQSRYFDNSKRIDRVEAAAKAARKAGDGDRVQAIQNDPLFAFIKPANKVDASIRKLNKLAVQVVGNKEEQEAIDKARIDTMTDLNEGIRALEAVRRGPTIADRLKVAR